MVNEYKHDCAIRACYPNQSGTRVCFIDANHKGHLYSPVDDHRLLILDFPASCSKVLWDTCDSTQGNGTFIAIDSNSSQQAIVTYIYSPQTTKGAVVEKLAETKYPGGFNCVNLYDGVVHGQRASGALSMIQLNSHSCVDQVGADFYSSLHSFHL
jgi:hypothetical protein